jgi:Cu-processing system ATP-binding protein
MITMHGVRKRFGTLQVLDGVDLTIASSRVTAIVGPNSAGKTTLIKSLLGLTHIDAGSIEIDGTPIDAEGRYRAEIGYMPQIARFPENLSANDVFDMMRHLRNAPNQDDELVDRLQLRAHLDKPLRVLSGGTRQKVNVALAFLFNPRTLVLDEPTSGLDPVSSAVVKDRIRKERAHGRTVIVTSHVMSELDELADEIAFLVEGRIRYAGTIHDLKKMTRQLNLERAIAHVLEQEAA